jgi:hypothetical protein
MTSVKQLVAAGEQLIKSDEALAGRKRRRSLLRLTLKLSASVTISRRRRKTQSSPLHRLDLSVNGQPQMTTLLKRKRRSVSPSSHFRRARSAMLRTRRSNGSNTCCGKTRERERARLSSTTMA